MFRRSNSHSSPSKQPVRLQVQQLEDRLTPVVAFALSNGSLIRFDTVNPSAALPAIPITGVNANETLVGIDFRPQNGLLYGFGVNATADTGTLYAISERTGVAIPVGVQGGISYVNAAGTAIDFPDPATAGYGVDFNPTVDRVRVVTSTGLNFRINPSNGTPIDGDAVAPMTNPDPGINIGGTPATVDATAYTNNAASVTATTQYDLDAVTNTLYIQNPPNNGTLINPLTVTLGGATLDFTNVNGFDIPPGVNVATSGTAATGAAFAVLSVGGATRLYSIELSTGVATLLGPIGAGTAPIQGFTIQGQAVPNGIPAIALSADGTQIFRFNTATPGTVVPINIPAASITMGEQLVAIDYRPATGQLYGLGINATANTGTLYLIDPQGSGSPLTTTVTVVGTASSIQYVQADGMTLVDFPDPATQGYGFDFNPTVDRIRVTTGNGLNFRINPNDGTPIDGNLNMTPAPNGINPDGGINGGGSTGITATAYTNSFAQVTGQTITTQYTLDSTLNTLFIQNAPNSGTQTVAVPITLGANPLDFTAISGFDIPPGVVAAASNAVVPSGFGYAILTVGGVTQLYSINLVTGGATALGNVNTGAASLAGLTLSDVPTGAVAFSSATFSASEGAGVLNVTLTRTSGTIGSFTVSLNVTGGTATAGTDFTPPPTTVTFADGQTTVTVPITLINDNLVEGNETIILSITNPTNNAVLGAITTTTATITDDDRPVGNPNAGLASAFSNPSGPIVTLQTPNGTSVTLNPFPGFSGNVTLATGDVTGDGIVDTIVGAGPGGGPNVKVFTGGTFAEAQSFFAYASNFTGGVNVTAMDRNNDGRADIVTGTVIGAPHVRVFNGTTLAEIDSFFAFTVTFTGGVFLAAGDTNGDGRDDLIIGAGSGGGPAVRVLNGTNLNELTSFFAFNTAFPGGVRVGFRDVDGNGTSEIVAAAGPGGGPNVRTFSATTFQPLDSFFVTDPNFLGGVFVG